MVVKGNGAGYSITHLSGWLTQTCRQADAAGRITTEGTRQSFDVVQVTVAGALSDSGTIDADLAHGEAALRFPVGIVFGKRQSPSIGCGQPGVFAAKVFNATVRHALQFGLEGAAYLLAVNFENGIVPTGCA
jgi:hypothetical protein